MTDVASSVLVDTNVVSFLFNNDSRADFYVERMQEKRPVISFQTLEEIRFGASKHGWGARRRNEMALHLDTYEVIWANPQLVAISAELRSERESAGRRLTTADAWIAATALLLDCPLASHDGDFDGIPSLQLIRDSSGSQ